ncbi:Transcriptional regulator, TetR family [Desulfosarcina cetonica]|uniref:CerR family C-terminal domain-containing protein n=1 Tax=Desulfosarcina cetonica TaxID=90730 RepID=UPI0006D29358|nr:CerR family C-terminal domain-containing protein [Desulfosarcina cetonica]VTR70554.1 Transcriptional regulator, TetR family [Desulfosarcina cetonica]
MAKRKDGIETRQKLLDVACDVFAEKGFREATITEICRRAGANVAAVNYYFGDKESLYVAAWRQTMEQFLSNDILPSKDLPPETRLRVAIHHIIHRVLVDDQSRGYFRRIELMELANPTGLIDDLWKAMIAPRQKELLGIIRDIIGPGASEDTVILCKTSIINQCRGYILTQKSCLESLGGSQFLTAAQADRIAEHITRFSIAGIKAVSGQADDQADSTREKGDGKMFTQSK